MGNILQKCRTESIIQNDWHITVTNPMKVRLLQSDYLQIGRNLKWFCIRSTPIEETVNRRKRRFKLDTIFPEGINHPKVSSTGNVWHKHLRFHKTFGYCSRKSHKNQVVAIRLLTYFHPHKNIWYIAVAYPVKTTSLQSDPFHIPPNSVPWIRALQKRNQQFPTIRIKKEEVPGTTNLRCQAFAVLNNKYFVGSLVAIHHHTDDIWGLHSQHWRQFALAACHRIRHKQGSALRSCAFQTQQPSRSSQHHKGLKTGAGEEEGERQQVPPVQGRIISCTFLAERVGEHEEEGAMRRDSGADGEEVPRVDDAVPSLAHTPEAEKARQRKPRQDYVVEMLR